eukprot:IDg8729t1
MRLVSHWVAIKRCCSTQIALVAEAYSRRKSEPFTGEPALPFRLSIPVRARICLHSNPRYSKVNYTVLKDGLAASQTQPATLPPTSAAAATPSQIAVSGSMKIRLLLNVHGNEKPKPIKNRINSIGFIATVQSTSDSHCNKHVDIHYYFVREKIASGKVLLEYVCTTNQLTEPMTRPLDRVKTERL